jgi:hypothetical protein
VIALLLAAEAFGGGKKTADDSHLSMTIGPVFGMTFPGADEPGPLQMAEIQLESKQAKRAGLGAFGAFGTVNDGVPGWEIGMNARGYLLGDFRNGLFLGAEGVYTRTIERADVPTGTGIGFGPFVGAKGVTNFGMTLDVQAGVGAGWAGQSFDQIEVFVLPLLNIGVGWTV